jgi:membrane-associated phospholipid phosphatase
MKIWIALFLLSAPVQAGPREAARATDAGVTALVLAGIFAHDRWDQRGLAAASQVLNFGITFGLKRAFSGTPRSCRPSGVCEDGFPSGHASQAFTSAGNLCLGGPAWLCASGVAVAGGVAAGRVEAEKHTWKQVGWGVGIGILNGYAVPQVTVGGRF